MSWKRNKYGAIKTVVDGITFDSKGEAGRYAKLKLSEKAGIISYLELQPTYDITINNHKVCKVKLDFRYQQEGQTIVEDFKGMDTSISKLKRKLVKAVHDVDVVVVKK